MPDNHKRLSADDRLVEKLVAALSPKIVAALNPRLEQIENTLTELRGDVEILRDSQIDQERDRQSLLLGIAAAGRGSIPIRQSNLTVSGTRFKTTVKDLKPGPIY